jgi:hypothetical protein
MKKKYLYVSAPLIGVIVFSGFYISARKTYDAKEDAIVRHAREIKEAKLKEEMKNREIAVRQALEQQDKRKAEKKAREEKETKEAEARAQAVQARSKASRDADKLEASVKRLQRDIDEEKKEIAKIEVEKKHLLDEQAGLVVYVKAAETNVKGLTAVLEKIVDADKKWEDAQKEAARAAAAAKK